MVRKDTTLTANKVTVSFLSFEIAVPAVGEGGLFLTVEMIIAYMKLWEWEGREKSNM